MYKPPYALLRSKYPDRRSVSADELYAWIGYPEYASDINWANTCALRMSLALTRSGVPVHGRLRVLKGECKDKMLEPGQANLSRYLVQARGAPEKFGGGPEARPTAVICWLVRRTATGRARPCGSGQVLIVGAGHWLRVGVLDYSDFATMLGLVLVAILVGYVLERRRVRNLQIPDRRSG